MNSRAKKQILIRSACPEDANDICRVHHLSVVGLAASHYTPRQIELWARGMTPQTITERLPAESARCLVAMASKSIQGFGIILDDEIRALYVEPNAVHTGLGRQLLQHLEALGQASGYTEFILNASLNAQGFYEAMGYTVQRETEFALGESETMACVAMKKHT